MLLFTVWGSTTVKPAAMSRSMIVDSACPTSSQAVVPKTPATFSSMITMTLGFSASA